MNYEEDGALFTESIEQAISAVARAHHAVAVTAGHSDDPDDCRKCAAIRSAQRQALAEEVLR